MSEQIKHQRPKYTLESKQDAAKLVNEKAIRIGWITAMRV